jgi:hypothetical protein
MRDFSIYQWHIINYVPLKYLTEETVKNEKKMTIVSILEHMGGWESRRQQTAEADGRRQRASVVRSQTGAFLKDTTIFDDSEAYVIVLEPLRNQQEYYLLTAHYHQHIESIRKKFRRRLPDIL